MKKKLKKILNPQQLKAATFNKGNCLVVAGAGSGKCVKGSSLVFTEKGIIPIKQIPNYFNVTDDKCNCGVITYSSKTGKKIKKYTSHWFNMGISDIYKLKLESGFEIEGTPENPVLTLTDVGDLAFKKLKDINSNDYVVLSKNNELWSSTNFKIKNYFNKEVELNSDIARLLGYLVADGTLHIDNSISFSNSEILPIKSYYDIVNSYFRVDITDIKVRSKIDSRTTDHYISVPWFKTDLKRFGLKMVKSVKKEIPHSVLTSSRECVIAFLQGYMDLESSVEGNTIEVTTASNKLAKQLQVVFLNLGIRVTLNPKIVKEYPDNKYWRLCISGNALRTYKEKINYYTHKGYRSELETICKKKSNTNKEVYPNQNGRLKRLKVNKQNNKILKDYLVGRRNPSSRKLKQILSFSQDKGSKDYIFLDNISDNFLFEKVDVCKNIYRPKRVYDFTVSKTHSFVVNGFVNHNTHALTYRVAYMIHKGVDPNDILLLTFTNKAAKEMIARVGKLVKMDSNFKIEGGTFHSFALKIMFRYIEQIEPRLKKFNVIDSSDSQNILKFLINENSRYHVFGFPKYKYIHSKFSYSINTDTTIAEAFKSTGRHIELITRLYQEFKYYKLKNGMVDYDDLLIYLLKILENKKLRDIISRRYRYILADECFPYHTPVLIDYDKWVPIGEVCENPDIYTHVLSYDLENKKIIKRKITSRKKTVKDNFITVEITYKGEKSYIVCTEDHKMHIVGKGTVMASDCKIGDKVIIHNGTKYERYTFNNEKSIISYKDFNSKEKKLECCPVCGKYFKKLKSHIYMKHSKSSNYHKITMKNGALNYWNSQDSSNLKKELSDKMKRNNPMFDKTVCKKQGKSISKIFWNKPKKERDIQVNRFINAPKHNHKPNNVEKEVINENIDNLIFTGDGKYFVKLEIENRKRNKNPDFIYIPFKCGTCQRLQECKKNKKMIGINTNACDFWEKSNTYRTNKVVEIMDFEYWHNKEEAKIIKKAYKQHGIDCLILDAKMPIIDKRAKIESFINNHYAEITNITKEELKRKHDVYDINVHGTHLFFVGSVSKGYLNHINCNTPLTIKTPILVHNCQDTNNIQMLLLKHLSSYHGNLMLCGDFSQCWSGTSKVKTLKGIKKIKSLKTGDNVRCVVKGEICYKPITNISKHENSETLLIETESGKKNIITPNHKCFTTEPEFDGSWYVYLMYSKDQGFRIGILSDGFKNTISTRTNAESCDFLWILKKCDDESIASYYESLYSLKYKIPKNPFRNSGRSIRTNQKHLNKIFKQFGRNGFEFLKSKGLSFEFPSFIAQGTSRRNRLIINLIFNQTDDRKYHIIVKFENKHLGRKQKLFNNYVSARIYAEKLKNKYNADIICERFRLPKNGKGGQSKYLSTVFAKQLTVGMSIPIIKNGKIVLDRITKIKKHKSINVYDIEVAESGNLIVGGIVSHNSIYAFRGADPKNLMKFVNGFKDVKVLKLEQNYRSTKALVSLSNNIPLKVDDKLSKTCFTENDQGTPANCYYALDNYDEALFVVEKIKQAHSEGRPYSGQTVLFRAGYHSSSIEIELQSNGIPFVKYGGFKFIEQAHIKDVLALIKICLFHRTDGVSWMRVLSNIKGVGKKNMSIMLKEIIDNRKGIEGLREFSDTKFKPELVKIYKLVKKVRAIKKPIPVFEAVIDYYLDYFVETYGDYKGVGSDPKATKRMADIGSLLKGLEKYKSIKKFITDLTMEPTEDEEEKNDKVVLSTVHSYKGLESDDIYIINIKKDSFPSIYSKKEEDIEEERRVFYVACTRAKFNLYLCTVLGNESIFIKELHEKGVLTEIKSEQHNEYNTC